MTQPGDTRVIVHSLFRISVLVHNHGTQLITTKRNTEKAYPGLNEKYRTPGIQPDQHGQNGYKPAKNQGNNQDGNDNVENTLSNLKENPKTGLGLFPSWGNTAEMPNIFPSNTPRFIRYQV